MSIRWTTQHVAALAQQYRAVGRLAADFIGSLPVPPSYIPALLEASKQSKAIRPLISPIKLYLTHHKALASGYFQRQNGVSMKQEISQ